MGEPVFIKYGSPSVSSRVTIHKQRDIKSCLREPEEVRCLTFCDLDNGFRWGPSNPDSSHKGIQQSPVSQLVLPNHQNREKKKWPEIWMLIEHRCSGVTVTVAGEWQRMQHNGDNTERSCEQTASIKKHTIPPHNKWDGGKRDWVNRTSEFVLIISPVGGC